ncbi:hypothetical protein GGI23_000094 [Coemansia sp. RSA 2559]|nr:hypothetical protein GGI23_000094 [Coemansia sp. RSA 2559]
MPDLSTHQPSDNGYECSNSGDPATYTDDSDSSSDENKAYSLGSSISNDGEATDTAQPPNKQSSSEDIPVDRPKSRRRLDPRVIGKYLSHRLSYTSFQKSRDAAVEEKESAATTGCTGNGWSQSVPAKAMVPGQGGGLVQLNTDFEKLGVCYDDLTDENKSGISETTRTTPWLFLLEETEEEPLLVRSLEKGGQTSGGDFDDLDSVACGCNPVVLPDEFSASSTSSSLTLSEIDLDSTCSSAKDMERQEAGCTDDVLDYDEYIYLSTSCSEDKENSGSTGCSDFLPMDPPSRKQEEEEGEEEEGEEEDVRRWWPRRVLPVRNMQYMPKLSKVFSDCRLQALYGNEDANASFLCAHCAHSNSDNGYIDGLVQGGSRFGGRNQQPVDEAMIMMDSSDSLPPPPSPSSASVPVYCSDSRCRYYHTRTSSVMRWLATGYPVKPVCKKESDDQRQQPDGHRLDYWDLLSRFPMRPTSSLALSSLKEMVVSLCSPPSPSASQPQKSGRSCVGLPGSRSSYIGTIVDSDDESTSDTEESSYSSSRKLGSSSLLNMQQQRSKQKQKRVLSEPMQYILYNSYLRYYGKPGEQTS